MVLKNKLIETLFKKDEDQAKEFKEWQELLKRVEQRYPNRKKMEIFYPPSKIFK